MKRPQIKADKHSHISRIAQTVPEVPIHSIQSKMSTTHTLILSSCILLTLLLPVVGQDLLPNGKVRPTIPRWYFTSAGWRRSRPEVLLRSFRRFEFCGTDYREGYSFRCETTTGPDFPTVLFRVASTEYRKEYFPPYYIAGNTKAGLVRPFPYNATYVRKGAKDGPRIRITCRVRTRRPVWIDIYDRCA